MKRFVLCLAVIGVLVARRRMFDRSDRAQGFGSFANVAPPPVS